MQLIGTLGAYNNVENQTIQLVDLMYFLSCNLRQMQLQNNLVYGTIPPEITVLDNLRVLNLGYNQLTGP